MILISLCIKSPCDYLVGSPISYILYPSPDFSTLIYCSWGGGQKGGNESRGDGTAIVQKVPIKHILCSARKVLNKAGREIRITCYASLDRVCVGVCEWV